MAVIQFSHEHEAYCARTSTRPPHPSSHVITPLSSRGKSGLTWLYGARHLDALRIDPAIVRSEQRSDHRAEVFGEADAS
jgi:hypothetical protein